MTVLTKDNFEYEVEKYNGLAVIDLYADWCGPCRMLSPILSELESEYEDVKFCKINIDEERELSALFKIDSVPTVAFVKDDTFLDLSVGYTEKTVLKDMIERYK